MRQLLSKVHKCPSVLMVTTSPVHVELMRTVLGTAALEGVGLRVEETLDDALAALDIEAFDLVLLDLDLPDGDSMQILTKTRTAAAEKPIVVLSKCDDNPALEKEVLERGAFCFLAGGEIEKFLPRTVHNAIEEARLQRELLVAQQSLERLVAEAQDAILVLDGSETIRFANPAARQLFLVRCEDLVGESFGYPITSPDATELDVPFQDGQVRTVEMRVSDTEWRGESAKLVILRDITERSQAERALAAAHAELEMRVRERTAELEKANKTLREQAALLELAHDAILVRDPNGKILYWNRGAEKTYGWTGDEALGENYCKLLRTRFPQSLEKITAGLRENLEWEGELHHERRSGETLVVASRWAIQRDSNNKVTSILEINRDISERKKAEEQLKTYMAKLEQSNHTLQDFASIASHDLQEPLRKVISFGNLLKESYAKALEEKGIDYLDRMLNATNRMNSLLNSLLEYSRVTSKAAPFSIVELGVTVRDVLSDLEVRLERTGGQVEVGELPVIEADPTQMHQLFQNLIGNALKFHKENEKPFVRILSVENGSRCCKISIEDNGIGFEEKYSNKIFAPFQRLHGKSSSYEGTGMGLAICKKIVERHGGTIMVRSNPGVGSTFVVNLPLRQLEGGTC